MSAVGFTGSTAGGRALYDLAVSRPMPIPFFGELGSVNPVVVSPASARARPAEIARILTESVVGSSGQLCTKPNLILVPEDAEALLVTIQDAFAEAGTTELLNGGTAERYDAALAHWRQRSGAERLISAGAPSRSARTAELIRLSDEDDLNGFDEAFGPATALRAYRDFDEAAVCVAALPGQLTVSIFAEQDELTELEPMIAAAERIAGRVIFDQVPTGVAVTRSMTHGGRYPATTAPGSTSVGGEAIQRWLRPVTYQNVPPQLLPAELRPASDDDKAAMLEAFLPRAE